MCASSTLLKYFLGIMHLSRGTLSIHYAKFSLFCYYLFKGKTV